MMRACSCCSPRNGAVDIGLARSHQVLAFTCHPYLAAMFEEEGARLTELPASPRARARAKMA